MVSRSLCSRTFVAAAAAVLLSTQAALANFHLMQIEQVIGGVNGDTTAQAIQLRMRFGGQTVLGSSRIRAWDAAGANPIVVVDPTTSVTNGAAGARVLITTTSFNAYLSPGVTPNFTMTAIPASYLAAGSLTFETNNGATVYWRLSWGGAGYTGTGAGATDNDNDPAGNFNPPFASPLPSMTLQAVRFTGAAGNESTSNFADYALTAGAAVFTNNANAAGTVFGRGACCNVGTPCTTETPPGCTALGRTYRGDNVACTPAACIATPTGACCNVGTPCTAETATACAGLGRTYHGDNVPCLPSPCVLGACCMGTGCTVVNQTSCEDDGGTWQGEKTPCLANTCDEPTEACCASDGSCLDMTVAVCNADGGTPQGIATACATTTCPEPTVACCTGAAACSDMTAGDCSVASGHSQGTGSTCAASGAACSIGACCTTQSGCDETTEGQCQVYICDFNALNDNHKTGAECSQLPGGCCFGDADGNDVVNAADRGFISANIGQSINDLICLFDVDGNGTINAADRGFVSANINLCEPLPDYQNGSGLNGGAPDTRFGTASFEGYGTNCAEVPCE